MASSKQVEPAAAPEATPGLQRLGKSVDGEANALASDPELVADFVLESREHLANIEAQLLILDSEPDNREAIHAAFRGFHTIKGLAGFLEQAAIQEVAHEIESVLDRAREGQFSLSPASIDVVLAGADFISCSIGEIETSGAAAGDPGPLVERVKALAAESSESAPSALPAAGSVRDTGTELRQSQAETRVVKVDTGKLDYLVDMVGEMVIAQSLVRHDPDLNVASKPRLGRNLSQLSRITEEVQRTAMAMRMVPVGPLFRKTARLVRDLARKVGKQAELETDGDEIEVDRTIVEELADPLMHMVRNAIDHGIETPAERRAAGKSETARVSLKARHEAGHIVVEIGDDGRGLDRKKILAKARDRGVVEDGSALSDNEVFNLIFLPGFSTAERVSDVSGRGVGMDVVRRHIQKLRGRIDIHSQQGIGSTFFLKLPLTLAIIDGLVVGVGSERYIIPLFSVREMLRPSEEQVSTLEGRHEMALVREHLLPVVRLHRRFGVEPKSDKPWEALLIVTESDGKPFCLMVDELIGKQEVVIKSLGEAFKDLAGVAGGAILGDGRVGLILDINALAVK